MEVVPFLGLGRRQGQLLGGGWDQGSSGGERIVSAAARLSAAWRELYDAARLEGAVSYGEGSRSWSRALDFVWRVGRAVRVTGAGAWHELHEYLAL